MREITIIVNPAAGRGRARTLLPLIEIAFARLMPRIRLTREIGGEEQLAQEAALGGAETIVAVGGDGTWGNVAHGIVRSGASPRLALIAGGTGNDFAKSVNLPAHDPAAIAALIAHGSERPVDLGLAGDRVFLNCCGTGFDTAVLARNARIPMLRGAPRYLVAAVAELFKYRGESTRIEPWPTLTHSETLLTVFANGRWFGGMFHIAPRALPDDGKLDAIRISDVSGLRRVLLLASAARGTHLDRTGVELSRGKSFTLTFEAPPLVNTDGEVRLATAAELTVSVLPGALRLVAPPAA